MSNDIQLLSSTVANIAATPSVDDRHQDSAVIQQQDSTSDAAGGKPDQTDRGYPAPKDEPEPNREQLMLAIDELRERLHTIRRTTLEFSIDDTTQKTVVKVIDMDKEEVILQLPSEQMLELARFFAADDLDRPKGERGQPRGLLIDERA